MARENESAFFDRPTPIDGQRRGKLFYIGREQKQTPPNSGKEIRRTITDRCLGSHSRRAPCVCAVYSHTDRVVTIDSWSRPGDRTSAKLLGAGCFRDCVRIASGQMDDGSVFRVKTFQSHARFFTKQSREFLVKRPAVRNVRPSFSTYVNNDFQTRFGDEN